MIGAPNTWGQKYWVGIVQWAPETSVSEEIADIFANYDIDVWSFISNRGIPLLVGIPLCKYQELSQRFKCVTTYLSYFLTKWMLESRLDFQFKSAINWDLDIVLISKWIGWPSSQCWWDKHDVGPIPSASTRQKTIPSPSIGYKTGTINIICNTPEVADGPAHCWSHLIIDWIKQIYKASNLWYTIGWD